ncbi:MAG TPA: hypothetical protein VFS81_01940, partial [Candidatus Binatia bacterium]|nr:hypothetical protein [Candidatus Binatia bacterium]
LRLKARRRPFSFSLGRSRLPQRFIDYPRVAAVLNRDRGGPTIFLVFHGNSSLQRPARSVRRFFACALRCSASMFLRRRFIERADFKNASLIYS